MVGEHPTLKKDALSALLDRTVGETLSMCGYIRPDKSEWAALRFNNGTRIEAHGVETEVTELRGHIPDQLTFTSWTFTDGVYTFTFENLHNKNHHVATFTNVDSSFDPDSTTRATKQDTAGGTDRGKMLTRLEEIVDRFGALGAGAKWNLPS